MSYHVTRQGQCLPCEARLGWSLSRNHNRQRFETYMQGCRRLLSSRSQRRLPSRGDRPAGGPACDGGGDFGYLWVCG